jgi:hypothetical protein
MTRSSDAVPIGALLEDVESAAGDLDLARLVHFDPRRRCVICATGLIDGSETMVGIGSIALDSDGVSEPDTLVVAEGHADGRAGEVAELLAGALTDRAVHAAQVRAA